MNIRIDNIRSLGTLYGEATDEGIELYALDVGRYAGGRYIQVTIELEDTTIPFPEEEEPEDGEDDEANLGDSSFSVVQPS